MGRALPCASARIFSLSRVPAAKQHYFSHILRCNESAPSPSYSCGADAHDRSCTATAHDENFMSDSKPYAPGWPGIAPRWTSSAKTGAGTALSLQSRVWFTISHGILNEVYFPRVDQACIRDFGLIVTNGRDFFSEEKRHCTFENVAIENGVPAYELTNTCMCGRYRI